MQPLRQHLGPYPHAAAVRSEHHERPSRQCRAAYGHLSEGDGAHPDRMPAILDPDEYEAWLTAPAEDAFRLIRPYPAENMVIHQQGKDLKSDRGGL